ncbi:MAG: zinc-binding dehydrogenase [Actinomycetota bacterium]
MADTTRLVRSTITDDGHVRITIVEEPTPTPGPDQVLVAVEAAPINPSDLGMLTAGADPSTFERGDDGALVGRLSGGAVAANAARVGAPMPVGNEGAGTVIAAGSSPEAQALVGRTVAGVSGAMYATHTLLPHHLCVPVPEGVSAKDAASSFVNPLTALGMTETMRLEGHTALVHTAAASNLGQMLNRLCQADGIQLVNIVRRDEQAELLRGQGAAHVVVSSAPTFADDLTTALAETGATIAFDAIGGGEQVDTILACMERASSADAAFSRYGSDTYKQVYIYGGLDRSPTTLKRTYGMTWGVGGWLLTPFLGRVGLERMAELRARVAAEITTTFASSYADTITLDQVLDPEVARAYAAQATGEKRLVLPAG